MIVTPDSISPRPNSFLPQPKSNESQIRRAGNLKAGAERDLKMWGRRKKRHFNFDIIVLDDTRRCGTYMCDKPKQFLRSLSLFAEIGFLQCGLNTQGKWGNFHHITPLNFFQRFPSDFSRLQISGSPTKRQYPHWTFSRFLHPHVSAECPDGN